MPNRFMCRAIDAGYCNQWLRACPGWRNCNLGKNLAPCPGCVASSPLDNPVCQDCEFKSWKEENYIENPDASGAPTDDSDEPVELDKTGEDMFEPGDRIVAVLLNSSGAVETTREFRYSELEKAVAFVKHNNWSQLVHEKTDSVLFRTGL